MTEKDAKRIEDKLYRDAHRDEINARRRAWYAVPENREKLRESQRASYQKNRTKILKKQKEYIQSNKDAVAEYHHKYYLVHKERNNENAKRWYREHREHALELKREYYRKNKCKILKEQKRHSEAKIGEGVAKIKNCAAMYREAADAIRTKLINEAAHKGTKNEFFI